MSSGQNREEATWRSTKRWFPDHPELGQAGHLPVEPFVSEEYCARERKLLWPHVWLMVGRVEDIARPGDYLIKEIPLNRVSLIVVRGRDDVVRAFHNVCPHRGSQILWECNGSTGRTNAFRCPYHAFTFDLTGTLKWVPDDANFYALDRDRLSLVEVRTDIWAGFIFVHLAPNPRETLLEYLGEIGKRLADFPFEKESHHYEYKADLDCNWKVLISGFLENYHTHALHKGGRSRACTPDNPYSHNETIELFDKHRLISLYRNPDMTPTKVGSIASVRYAKSRARGVGAVAETPGALLFKSINPNTSFVIHNIFPNFQLNIANGAWFYHQFWPLSANRVRWESRMHYPKPKNASERFFQEYAKVTSRDILLEDGNVSERSQMALESGAIDSWTLQDEEIAIQHFNKVVADYTECGSERG